jgi:hypothetical protein
MKLAGDLSNVAGGVKDAAGLALLPSSPPRIDPTTEGGAGPGPLTRAQASFGKWPYRLGVAFGVESRHLLEVSDVAGRALSRLTGKSEWGLVYEFSGLLALWVGDLPASERHHHHHPFGLFEHSLEVAATLAQDLDRRWNSGQGAQILTREERSMWARVAYVTALLHDIGKVLDVVVSEPGGRAEWDPLQEPLTFFKRRWSQALGDPSTFRYRRKRGMNGHEAKGAAVAQVILSAIEERGLAPLVQWALAAYVERHRAADPTFPVPLGYLVTRLCRADFESSSFRRVSTVLPFPGSPESLAGGGGR